MRFDIITLFPEMFGGVLSSSIIARAIKSGAIDVRLHHLREYATDKHKTVDAPPFGGGAGMVLKAEPLFRAWEAVKSADSTESDAYTIVTSPQGEQFTQATAEELQTKAQIIVVCGHYGGIDERFIEHAADAVLSVGSYVLTGGELAAMVFVDAIARLVPDVLGNPDSAKYDTFSRENDRRAAPPVYTRPAEFRGLKAPEVLLSGDHTEIDKWRKQQSELRSRNLPFPSDEKR